MDLKKIDKRISEINKRIDFYSFLTPVNQKEEEKIFFDELGIGKEYNPVFYYRGADFSKEKKELSSMLSEAAASGEEIKDIFIKKIKFLIKQLELLDADGAVFTAISEEIYGKPDEKCLEESVRILMESIVNDYVFPEETVTPKEMRDIIGGEIKRKNIDWACELSDKIVPKITVSGKERTIFINKNISYTAEEVERLKVHEVQVHIYRGANGAMQPFEIFAEGLVGYDETEEGLAIAAEEAMGCLDVDTRQMKLYAGRAVCTEYCLKGSFHEAFQAMREFFPDYMAYRLVERSKRGISDTFEKGAITKGFHYISGKQKVHDYVEAGGDLSILYAGKIGLGDVPLVRGMLEQGVLQKAKYLPEFLKQ